MRDRIALYKDRIDSFFFSLSHVLRNKKATTGLVGKYHQNGKDTSSYLKAATSSLLMGHRLV